MFRIALCDDSKTFLLYEKDLIKEISEKESLDLDCDLFLSGHELIESIHKLDDYNLFILDYDMDGMTGFETASLIRKYIPNAFIAFATSYYDFTREGYKYGAVRYLVKVEDTFAEDLKECINYVFSEYHRVKRIILKLYGGDINVDIDNIIYIESNDHYVKYFIRGSFSNENNICRSRLDDIETELPKNFLRIHQRYIVNLTYVLKLYSTCFEIRDENGSVKRLPIARNRFDSVRKHYFLWKGRFG